MAEGKKNRKVGKSKRKPSNTRYVAEKRWDGMVQSDAQPVAWMMKWPNHAPSFTTVKSDYVHWYMGDASYPDNLIPLYTSQPATSADAQALERVRALYLEWRAAEAKDLAPDSTTCEEGRGYCYRARANELQRALGDQP